MIRSAHRLWGVWVTEHVSTLPLINQSRVERQARDTPARAHRLTLFVVVMLVHVAVELPDHQP